MIDRTELDLRFGAHVRMARALNGHGWAQVTILPSPRPHATLAALLVALATRLDAGAALAGRETAAIAPPTPA